MDNTTNEGNFCDEQTICFLASNNDDRRQPEIQQFQFYDKFDDGNIFSHCGNEQNDEQQYFRKYNEEDESDVKRRFLHREKQDFNKIQGNYNINNNNNDNNNSSNNNKYYKNFNKKINC